MSGFHGHTPVETIFLDEYMPRLKISGIRTFLALCRNNGATRSELRYLTGLSKQGSVNGTNELLKFGLVTNRKLSPVEAKKYLFIEGATPLIGCSWCKTETRSLHEHHYPLPQREGGEKTARICVDCHQKFHSLVDDGVWLIGDLYKSRGVK